MSAQQEKQQKNNEWNNKNPGQSQWGEFIDLIKSIVLFLGIAFMLRATVVEAFKIPSSSMEPTLQIGDHILVNKLSYGLWVPLVKESLRVFREPVRDDVVVFTLPDDPSTPGIDESDTNIIKRVVAVGGDRVELRGMKLFINNALVEDDHAVWRESGRRSFGPTIVPDGKVLLFGDNRDYSKDARYWSDPFLEIERIKGRAFFIYWSWHSFKRIFSLIA